MLAVPDGFDTYAVIILAVVLREQPESSVICVGGVDYVDGVDGIVPRVEIITVEQSVESWLDVVRGAARLAGNPAFSKQAAVGDMVVCVDNTLGTPIIARQVRDMSYYGVPVTTVRRDDVGQYTPLHDVVGALISSYQGGMVTISSAVLWAESMEIAVREVTLRDCENIGGLALGLAHVAYHADKATPDFSDDSTVKYETYGSLE